METDNQSEIDIEIRVHPLLAVREDPPDPDLGPLVISCEILNFLDL